MSKQKKTSTDRIAAQVSEQLNRALAGIDIRTIGVPKKQPAQRSAPPGKRQHASASTATKRRTFSDEPGVQQTLFDLDQGGAR